MGSEFESVVERWGGSDMGVSGVGDTGHVDKGWRHMVGSIEGALGNMFLLADLFLLEDTSVGFKKARNASSGPLN